MLQLSGGDIVDTNEICIKVQFQQQFFADLFDKICPIYVCI